MRLDFENSHRWHRVANVLEGEVVFYRLRHRHDEEIIDFTTILRLVSSRRLRPRDSGIYLLFVGLTPLQGAEMHMSGEVLPKFYSHILHATHYI